jgi:hypothetical protein
LWVLPVFTWRVRSDERQSALLISFGLGVVLVVSSFWLYFDTVSPPDPPAVNGAGEVYVSDPTVLTRFSVTFPAGQASMKHAEVIMTLAFLGQRSAPVDWAIVLYDDARLIDASDPASFTMPPGAKVADTHAGAPPFAANPTGPVQVISGRVHPTNLGSQAGAVLIKGKLGVSVASEHKSTFNLSLPRYGRVHLSPLFQFPGLPGAINIGIPGDWHRPDRFQVAVDAGPTDARQRIDIASPDVADPTVLRWESDESVRAVIRRTDLRKEARQQTEIFILGAIVGAGASAMAVAIERWLTSLRRVKSAPARRPQPAAQTDSTSAG